jgi:3-deoxy-D-manno-octulosonic-acid transferase
MHLVRPVRALVTTNTSQGIDILQQAAANAALPRNLEMQSAFFPFDRPSIMSRAIRSSSPRLAVLLETELWPGFLGALKAAGIPIALVNGRLTPSSLRGYRCWPNFWRRLAPRHILAVSREDARRFGRLFGPDRVEVMANMKFDRLSLPASSAEDPGAVSAILDRDAPFLILGSIRREEEDAVSDMVQTLLRRRPDLVIGLFPRHMQRVEAWEETLSSRSIPWLRRSRLEAPAPPGNVVVWDVFGELAAAYDLCRTCFVGGSLVPLGGQNFLEPLSRGILPVIGPHWDNFAWVGREILSAGLVRQASDWRHAVEILEATLASPPERKAQRSDGWRYMDQRRGGTAYACRRIEKLLFE